MSNALVLSKDIQVETWDFAGKLAKSKMIPMMFQGKQEDIFATILYGNELGLSPIMSLNAICVIQGTVTLKVQTMNAIVRSKHREAIISIVNDEKNLSVTVTAKRDANDPGYTSFWDMNKAKLMGLASKNNWIVQPMNMLKARALSDALRAVFPDSLLGLYSTEEMEDLPPIVNSQSMLDTDFPIPPEEKIVGDLYRIQNGGLRGKQLKDLEIDEIAEYREKLVKRDASKRKDWENDLISVFTQYLGSIDRPIEVEIEGQL